METKKTIAILGIEKGLEKAFLDQLANDNRLLIISSKPGDCGQVSDYLSQNRFKEQAELVECPKDGCWEADIIMLWHPENQSVEELSKLQEVATQKIVLLIIEKEASGKVHIPSFPHSKIVKLNIKPNTQEATLSGDYSEAVEIIYQLVIKTGIFKIQINYLES